MSVSYTHLCNYLKNIRNELLEEDDTRLPIINNEIIYINAEIEGTFAQLMIDTGANVSIINTTELERIQGKCGKLLPTLPINNIVLILSLIHILYRMCFNYLNISLIIFFNNLYYNLLKIKYTVFYVF